MSYEFPSAEERVNNPDLDKACQYIEKLLVKNGDLSDMEEALASEQTSYTYTSTQATKCAGCLKHKHTPLRIDEMGGYVCLTCIDKALTRKVTAPVIPKNWNIVRWGDDGFMVFWPNGRGQTHLKHKEIDQPIEALIFADLVKDLMAMNDKVLNDWFKAGEFPPVNATVMALGSPGYEDIGVVTIKAYGETLCVAENEEGKEIVFEYNDNTFRPLSDKD